LQIVLALAGLMLLAFVPLFFAVASLTRATVIGARQHAARVLGRTVAMHVSEARALRGPDAGQQALERDVQADDAEAACVVALDGVALSCAGAPFESPSLRTPGFARVESSSIVRGSKGRSLETVTLAPDFTLVSRTRLDDADDHGRPLVRLVALYMITFGLALLVFAYLVLTRLIVRPVEQLVAAADRVASGARTLGVPRSGARELIELGASVQAMAEKLIREEAALILKVEELTQTTTRLTRTQAQLVRSERMASVGHLAAGIAHEIGNPIAALMGMQDLLLEGQLPAETQTDFLGRMRRETQRIHTVVRGLLDFARPEGAPRPDAEGATSGPGDVAAVVDDVVGLVRPHKPFRDVRIDTEVEASLLVALAAPRLTQVLLNIVLNAGAALASTGRAGGRIVIRAHRDRARVRIEVEDNGPGVLPVVRDRIFEPFVTTKDVGEGTGLGLAVCRGLVESAGGEVGIGRSSGDGVLFYVVLPAAVP
jgi:two-component system, NtrC family, sensor kinase